MWAAEDVAFKYYATSLAGDVAEEEALWEAEDVAFNYYATSLAGDVAEKEIFLVCFYQTFAHP
jgi:hypothetical protein